MSVIPLKMLTKLSRKSSIAVWTSKYFNKLVLLYLFFFLTSVQLFNFIDHRAYCSLNRHPLYIFGDQTSQILAKKQYFTLLNDYVPRSRELPL